ncbi:MAG: sulfurtransferase complex subunit TusD [Gammaproteobacteria bacterium TMED1]|nr:MAG: sulfurtransferase complex subunit TusD [Gammaproteobacteria bacterium TMED1]|tara:strand:+ start:870 stop:1262 length:393 start_codon:yes stop_codon:yes gene_type:complete
MKFAIVVHGAPYSDQAARSAYLFARSVIEEGHEIYRIFFYHDGVYNANLLSVPPQDEAYIESDWASLGREHQLDMVVCISSALRRGILNEAESNRYERVGTSINPIFTVSGLGQLIDAAIQADKLVTFGV